MAGSPTFTRAKHYTHFHTSHKSIFEGAETQHVKTNLTASIDGDYTLTADSITLSDPVTLSDTLALGGAVDCGGNELNNPKNVLRTEKATVTHADVTATGLLSGNASVYLFRASPGDTICNVVGNSRVAWLNGASLDKTRLTVGDAADPDGFAMSHLASPIGWIWDGEAGTDKGAYLIGAAPATPLRVNKTYTAGTDINAIVNASLWWGASLDAGEIDIYIDVMSRA